jgi:hypothetical protein
VTSSAMVGEFWGVERRESVGVCLFVGCYCIAVLSYCVLERETLNSCFESKMCRCAPLCSGVAQEGKELPCGNQHGSGLGSAGEAVTNRLSPP